MRMSDWSSDVCSSDLIDEDDFEFGLLFSGRCSSGSSRASNGNSSGGGTAPLLFQSLGQFSGFQNGQFGQLVNESVNVCHVNIIHIGPHPHHKIHSNLKNQTASLVAYALKTHAGCHAGACTTCRTWVSSAGPTLHP